MKTKIIIFIIFTQNLIFASTQPVLSKNSNQKTLYIPLNVQEMLEKCAKMSIYTDQDTIDVLEKFMNEDAENVNAIKKESSESFAMLASQVDQPQINAFAYNKNVNYKQKDKHGWTVLHHATLFGELSTVIQILDNGGDPKAKANNGLTPLAIVSNENNDDIITERVTKFFFLKRRSSRN